MNDRFGHAPDRLCVIRLSAIGDCCHTLPVIRTLQSVWPTTKITWIIGRTEFALMENVDGVEFITFDKRGGWSELIRLRRQLKQQRFDLLLHMHASMRANLASLCVRSDRRIGFDRARARDNQWMFAMEKIPAKSQQHVIDGLFGFLEHLGISERTLRWDIPVAPEDIQFADRICTDEAPIVVLSPCSSQRFRNFRNWPVSRYVELVDYLHARYAAKVLLTGGPTALERDYGAQITAQSSGSPVNLIGQTTLKQLFAVIDRAALVVCPDSGPAHMATAAGTPVVGLYATSNRFRTGPYLSQHLTVDRYPDAVEQEFGEPVEALRWGQRVRDPDAMKLITLEDVTEKIDLVLSSGDRLAD